MQLSPAVYSGLIKYHAAMTSHISLKAEVTEELSGNRLDQIAAKLFPEYSRARLQSWIREGTLLVNNKQLRPRDRLEPGDCLVVEARLEAAESWVCLLYTSDAADE